MSVTASPPSGVRACTGIIVARSSGVAAKLVFFMPSGVKRWSARYASRVCPDTASTTRPSQSLLMPYSQRVPGSVCNGVASDVRRPLSTLGVPVTSWYFVRSGLTNQYPWPAVWVSRWRIVACVLGARRRGSSPSHPSSTCRSFQAGRIDPTSSSRLSRPCSISCNAAALASALVIDAMRNRASVLSGAPSPSERVDPPAARPRVPSRSTTIATAPGTAPVAAAASSTPPIASFIESSIGPPLDVGISTVVRQRLAVRSRRFFDKLSKVTERAEFTLNGTPVSVRADHPHLLAALREELDVTSPKDGCSPSGQCGCCTVLVDGKAVVSCNLGLDKIAGKEVVTLEGVDPDERRRFADAFAACGGLQCGFCIPGIVMRAKAQIDKKGADLDRAAMAPHLGAHLCRCTGYVKILDAIEAVAKGKTFQPALGSGVGVSGMKYEAAELALGDRDYIDDMRVPGMLHAALHLTAHARADVVAIDTTAAAAAPGVRRRCSPPPTCPASCGSGSSTRTGRSSSPSVGARRTPVTSWRSSSPRPASRRVTPPSWSRSRYDVLAPVTDPLAAIEDGAPIAVWGTDGNVLSRSAYARGDVDAALAASAHTVHEVFQTQRIDHAFLEPESTLAVPSGAGDDRRLHVYSGGQGVWDDRDDICRVLAVDTDRVVVELVSNGGAFGGKEDMANQAQTALAAWLLDRPVKCTVSREESFRIHSKRHPIRLEYWAGCDADGVLDGGAGAGRR